MKKNLIFCWVLILLVSCKFKVQDKVVPEWEAEVLGPLVTANLTAQDLADIDPLHAQKTISMSDLGVLSSGIAVTIPAIGPIQLGPYNLDFSDAFGLAEFESGELYFTIRNELEVDARSGTRIIISDGSTSILKDTLKTDLSAYTGFYTSPIIDLADRALSSSLSLVLENFRTLGTGSAQVLINTQRRLIIDIYIRNVKFRKIAITTTDFFSIADTSEFSLEGGVIKSQSIKGTINTYVNNSFPVNLMLQIYFMDETNSIQRDSLFDSPAIIQAMKDGKVLESKFTTTINDTKTENLNKARFVRSFVRASTGNNVIIYDTTAIKVKMVGDLKVKVEE